MRSASLSRLPDRRRTRPPGASGFLVPLSLRSVAGTTAVTGAVVAAVLTERGPLTQALAQLEGGRRLPLVLAAICAPVVPATTAAAWRSVLASQGLPLRKREAWRCYGLGSLVNTLLPGRAGDAIRVELFSRRLDHERRRWLACGAAASIGLAQSVVFGTLLTTGSLLGELPHWVALAALIYPLVLWLGKRLAAKLRPGGRLACVATASTLSPSASIRLLCWIGAGAVVRLVVVASILGALSVPHPFACAIVAICGLGAGHMLPFAPGFAGVAAAAMTVALAHAGVDNSTALAAAVCFHTLETTAGVLFAVGGSLVLQPLPRARAVSLAGALR